MKKWKCTVCGYLADGDQPPDHCPVCGAHRYQFILYGPLPESLEGLLKDAFAGESKAQVRNQAFAQKATQEGYPQIAGLFKAVAEAERIHARSAVMSSTTTYRTNARSAGVPGNNLSGWINYSYQAGMTSD